LPKTRAALPLFFCLFEYFGAGQGSPAPLPGMDAGQVGINACWDYAVFSLAVDFSKCRSRAFLVPVLQRNF